MKRRNAHRRTRAAAAELRQRVILATEDYPNVWQVAAALGIRDAHVSMILARAGYTKFHVTPEERTIIIERRRAQRQQQQRPAA